jgi:hypothetical protein
VGLPDRDSASTWGGKLLVDRDGTEIGTCTQIFLDDATGLPEWAQADLSGGPGVVPLMDAAESGDRVRVAVRRSAVEDAPLVEDPLHISLEEEERLYRHYGITFSQEESESLLPVEEPVPAQPDAAQPEAGQPEAGQPDAAQPAGAEADVAEPATQPAVVERTSPATSEVTDDTHGGRRGLLPALAAGAVGVLAAVAAAVFWWRQRRQIPPTRSELLAARARSASLALGTRKDQVAASAAPLLRTGRRLSTGASQQAAVQARVAMERASVQARVAAERVAAQARTAAEQAAALTAAARTSRLQRVPSEADLEAQRAANNATDGRQRRDAVMSALGLFSGFAAGYAVRGRTAAGSSEQPQRAGSSGRGQQVQRIAGRVTDTVRTGTAQVSQRGSAVAGKLRRSSGSDEEASSGWNGSGPSL